MFDTDRPADSPDDIADLGRALSDLIRRREESSDSTRTTVRHAGAALGPYLGDDVFDRRVSNVEVLAVANSHAIDDLTRRVAELEEVIRRSPARPLIRPHGGIRPRTRRRPRLPHRTSRIPSRMIRSRCCRKRRSPRPAARR